MIEICNVCKKPAHFEVFLYDVYLTNESVFFEQDFTCKFLCKKCMVENERRATGVREPHGVVEYPFTNRHGANGFTIYRHLDGK